jgi:hypothetical protein
MTSPDKPLHVRVAEVLGFGHVGLCSWGDWHFTLGSGALFRPDFTDLSKACAWEELDGPRCEHGERYIPRFDTSWSATGPLIERFGINLAFLNDNAWEASRYNGDDPCEGRTPLLAVCNLIVAAPHISLDTTA